MSITLDQLTDDSGMAVREWAATEVRAEQTDDGTRTITGIGVPYGAEYVTPWFREIFEPGAITDDSQALAFWQHRDPIGKVTASRDTDAGREVTLRLSSTPTADEAYTLARDGVIRSLSIGFVPVKWREERSNDDDVPLIVHEQVEVREYSLVPFPAYPGAAISTVRHHHTTPRPKEPSMTTTVPTEDLATRADLDAATTALGDQIDDLRRMSSTPTATAEPLPTAAQFRSIGEWVQAAVSDKHERHDAAVALYRDVTTGDVPSTLINTPGFIGDLTKKITVRRRWLNRFTSKPLPAKGMSVDYVTTSRTAKVSEQLNELDALAKGSTFAVTPATAPVRTFGGAETVSRQVIDRLDASTLTGMFEAFAMEYARQTEAATKTYVVAEIDKIKTAAAPGTTIEVPAAFGAFDWIDGIVDAAGRFEDLGYDLQTLAVSADIFKRLAAEAGTDGRPLMTVSGTGTNVVGTMDLPAASGELLRVPVSTLHNTDPLTAAFIDPIAIETRESAGAPLWISNDQPLTLSRDYACYGYLAHITPHPQAILPVTFTAAAA